MVEIDTAKLQAFKEKLQCLITTHNDDTSAHRDIRSTINGKANSSHTHNRADLNNIGVVEVVVTYTDESTETIKLLKDTSS